MNKLNKILQRGAALVFLLTMSNLVSAALMVDYTLTDNGANNYTYNYSVDNTAGPDILGFGVDFDVALFAEASLTLTTPAGWDGLVLGSIPSVAPASADWENLAVLFAAGNSASGFAVTFDWLGSATGPGSQDFYTYDLNYDYIDFGVTALVATAPGPGTVPAPGVLVLLSLGFLGFSVSRKIHQS